MELIRLIGGLIVIISAGWVVLSFVCAKTVKLPASERLAVSYGLGVGCISLWMLMLYIAHVPFSIRAILVPWCVLIGAFFAFSFRKGVPLGAKVPGDSFPGRPGSLGAFFLIGACTEACYALFRAALRPLESYDAVAIYGLKSKIFLLAKTIPEGYFSYPITIFPHPDYPLSIPFIQTFVYMVMGTMNDALVKVIFVLFFVSGLVILYHAIRRFAKISVALLFVFMAASVPQFNAHATNGYLEIALAYYWFSGMLYLFLWFREPDRTPLVLLSAILVGLGAWTKNEGIMYCVIALIIMTIFIANNIKKCGGRGLLTALMYATVVTVIATPWVSIVRSSSFVNEETGLAGVQAMTVARQAFGKIPPILYEFQKEIFNFKKWNILWPVIAACFVFRPAAVLRGANKYIALSLVLAIGGYVIVYLASPLEIRYFVSKTWGRFLLHFMLVAIFLAALCVREDIPL